MLTNVIAMNFLLPTFMNVSTEIKRVDEREQGNINL